MAYFDQCNLPLSIVSLTVKFVQSLLTSYPRSHPHHNFKTLREYKVFLHRFSKRITEWYISGLRNSFSALKSLFKIFTKLVYNLRNYTNYLVPPTLGNERIVCNQACQWFHKTMNKWPPKTIEMDMNANVCPNTWYWFIRWIELSVAWTIETRGQFNKTFTPAIYKCSHCFRFWKQ